MKMIILSFILLPSQVYSLARMDNFASSYLRQRRNARLTGHAISRMSASSFATCGQLCLIRSKCKSVSYAYDDRLCELYDQLPDENNVVSDAQAAIGWFVTIIMEKYEFTSLGAIGENGPQDAYGYNGSNLQGKVSVVNGIQTWTLPYTAVYTIEVSGASGANGTCKVNCKGWSIGGRGATIKGTFNLKKGTELKIIIGQQGFIDTSNSIIFVPGGGGGGSFVATTDNMPLIVAGGGGGGGHTLRGLSHDGDPGQVISNGSRYGGYNGTGGFRYDEVTKLISSSPSFPVSPAHFSSAGAGYFSNGDCLGSSSPQSFINGGKGGKDGGFGGGGFPLAFCPGGGGGYSGGGVIIDKGSCWAGGGGSLNKGYDKVNHADHNHGDGRVIIRLLQ